MERVYREGEEELGSGTIIGFAMTTLNSELQYKKHPSRVLFILAGAGGGTSPSAINLRQGFGGQEAAGDKLTIDLRSSSRPGGFEMACHEQIKSSPHCDELFMRRVVPKARLELARAITHHPLKMACLPVPPLRQNEGLLFSKPPHLSSISSSQR